MILEIINQSSTKTPKSFLEKWMSEFTKILSAKKLLTRAEKNQVLTLVFLNPIEAMHVNEEFRGKHSPTDVLSFTSLEPLSFGELVLCPEVLKKQAKEHQLKYHEELGYMIIHGVLHLKGFDHEKSKKEAEKMFTLQDEIFEKLLLRVKKH